ncbi:MAG: TRAP transporter permease [Acetobacterales bacterium]
MTDRDTVAAPLPVSDPESSQGRTLSGWQNYLLFWATFLYAAFHLVLLNLYPIDPWIFRSIHVSFGCAIGFAMYPLASGREGSVPFYDWLLGLASLGCAVYIAWNLEEMLFRVGALPTQGDFIVGLVGVLLILELTRRCTGLALPIISSVFILYCFAGPWLPGILHHNGFEAGFLFSYIYSMEGVFGPTTAVSSTYIILFIVFSAFLNTSKVGDYFIEFAMSIAGWARGGPAKVAVISSALMGTINGTSAGNVVATGTFTIPLMKRVGYPAQTAAAIEAAASTGGQIMPPIMGAGAFIMAEITGIPYQEIMIAAIIPALLYFVAIFCLVDLESRKRGMRGLSRRELPRFLQVMLHAYKFLPLVVLVYGLISGYSVIRAGTLGLLSAVLVSWLNPEGRMGPRRIVEAMAKGGRDTIQLMAVCACAGIIVGIIGLTGIGQRFSSMLLLAAEGSQLLALIFAMLIAILLGMGMPTTAAYAVAASVVAPGLIQLGVAPLVAHMFVFYFAVISAITPPVALAAYAAAGISGSDPMKTSVTAFMFGLSAFIVPFMFFYQPGLLMQGEPLVIARMCATAVIGVYLLSCALQGWFLGMAGWAVRAMLGVAALCLIAGDLPTDFVGAALALAAVAWQRIAAGKVAAAKGTASEG